MKIMLAEDEPALRSAILDCLRQDSYVCEVAPTYEVLYSRGERRTKQPAKRRAEAGHDDCQADA